EPVWVDDFTSGSAAAIAGGITTIGNMSFPAEGESLRQAVARDLAKADATAMVDFVVHQVMFGQTPDALAEIPLLAQDRHMSLKLFMTPADFDEHADVMIDAVVAAGRHGMLTLIHCEDGALLRHAVGEL